MTESGTFVRTKCIRPCLKIWTCDPINEERARYHCATQLNSLSRVTVYNYNTIIMNWRTLLLKSCTRSFCEDESICHSFDARRSMWLADYQLMSDCWPRLDQSRASPLLPPLMSPLSVGLTLLAHCQSLFVLWIAGCPSEPDVCEVRQRIDIRRHFAFLVR